MNFSGKPLIYENETLYLIDQRKLPLKEEYIVNHTIEDGHKSIKDMVVRGAPLIGFTAIWSMALWVKNNPNFTIEEIDKIAKYLITARPTAVNLEFESNRIVDLAKTYSSQNNSVKGFYDFLCNHGFQVMEKIAKDNLMMAKIACEELTNIYGDKKLNLMTLCNTGYLACGPMGTALGVISYAHKMGMLNHVYASETRPYLQGSRLTAYELVKEGISHEISVEGAFSHMLKNKMVDAIFIGADRIAGNGDTANKIGSSTLSIVAKYYGVPFYVVAPVCSFDTSINNGNEISIELRDEKEILDYKELPIAPRESHAFNPSFDITDHKIITGIICEKGMIRPLVEGQLRKVVKS